MPESFFTLTGSAGVGEHEEAVLRFFFGNLFVNFSLLWKPTIALIDEFSARDPIQ